MRLSCVVFCVLLVACPSRLHGQSFTGTITGTVKDASGAVIPQVTVTITNQQTERQETVTADLEGRYTSLPLPPGEYKVEAELQGFRRAAQSNVTVQINGTAVIDFTLEVGELTDAVEVSAVATVLETTTSTMGKLVDNRRILNLPLNTRNMYSLIYLTPGVAGSIGNNYNSMSYSVNGARATMMDTVIDGVTASHPTVKGYTGISVFPSVDAIEEFKVLGANYAAEYGRSLGSVLNVVYKSGTNDFHGTAYEFLRDSALTPTTSSRTGPACPWAISSAASSAGSPRARPAQQHLLHEVLRGSSRAASAETTATVPTLAQRRATSRRRSRRTGMIQLYDPFTTRANPSGPGSSATRFPATSFRLNRMDPVARNVLKLLPSAKPAGRSRHRNAELLHDRVGRAEHRQLRRARRPPAVGRARVRALFVPQALQRPRDVLPIGDCHRRRADNEQTACTTPSSTTPTMSNTTVLGARLGFARTLYFFDNQGLGFKPSSLGPAGVDRRERRPGDVPPVRRQRHVRSAATITATTRS